MFQGIKSRINEMKQTEIKCNRMQQNTRVIGVLSVATTENQEVEGLYSFSVTNSNHHLLIIMDGPRKIPAAADSLDSDGGSLVSSLVNI